MVGSWITERVLPYFDEPHPVLGPQLPDLFGQCLLGGVDGGLVFYQVEGQKEKGRGARLLPPSNLQGLRACINGEVFPAHPGLNRRSVFQYPEGNTKANASPGRTFFDSRRGGRQQEAKPQDRRPFD